MASVALKWSGACSSSERQDELLNYMLALADLHEHFILNAPRPAKHPLLDFVSAARAKGLAVRPNIEFFDGELVGSVAMSSTLVPAAAEAVQNLRATRPELFGSGRAAGEAAYVVNLHGRDEETFFRASRVHVRGINFRIYDPRELYPGEDRVSFTFITDMDPPIFNGAICECFHRTRSPGLIDFEQLGRADWYVRNPEIHLRRYLERWFEQLLSWIKLFIVPSLQWWLHTNNAGYDDYLAKHSGFESFGRQDAMDSAFEEIKKGFFDEAEMMLIEIIKYASAGSAPDTTGAS